MANTGWVKGMPKVAGSGMKKGQVTKRVADTQETFQKIVDTYGDPLLALAEMAFNPANDITIRHSSLKEVSKYGYAQRRAVEISGPDGSPLAIDMRMQLIGQITEAFEKLATK
jgi:hypothetical protein